MVSDRRLRRGGKKKRTKYLNLSRIIVKAEEDQTPSRDDDR
jgi:hypothetical protein